jgi:succinyl-CoA synthetase beta subunit
MTGFDEIAKARKQGRAMLDEAAGKRLLGCFGIRVPRSVIVSDAAHARGALAGIEPPYVVKVVSPEIVHKSDAGGVKVGLRDVEEAARAIAAMGQLPRIRDARVEGYLVEEMAPAGQEIVVGGLRDPQFGPLVMAGLGGIFVEVLADVAFRICPITREDAEEMLSELKGAALLDGARGRKAVSRPAILEVLLKVGGDGGLLMVHAQDIEELDINPLIVSESGAVAVDARLILTQPPMDANKNL